MDRNVNPNNVLNNCKKDEKYLIENIKSLSLRTILDTQKLSAHFCAQYILNDIYQTTAEERNITIDDVLLKQEHLNEQDIIDAL
jgi:hypothetical protein